MLLPGRAAEYEVRTIQTEGVTFYPERYRHWYNSGFRIAIQPGADVRDVEITVRHRMRIRGSVLSADGTPLRDAQVQFRINQRSANGRQRSSKSGPRNLDSDGHFVEYLKESAFYTITVAYQGQFAESEKILLEDGQRLDGLVLTLRDDPDKPSPSESVVKPIFKPAMLAAPKPSVKPKVAIPPRAYDPQSAEAARKREREGMWAINPDNRRAYKVVHCKTREEAEAKAAAQGAHLVAINNQAEQEWLLAVFGGNTFWRDEELQQRPLETFKRESFWIGLADEAKQDALHWDNGEPVTYTNWDSPQKVVGSDTSTEHSDGIQYYTVFVGTTGKWKLVAQASLVSRYIDKAILEKENFIADTFE